MTESPDTSSPRAPTSAAAATPASARKGTQSASRSTQDALTFLVFKEGLTARTFQISAGWISRLGLLLGALALITAGAIFLTARTYVALHQAKRNGDPARVHELEAELAQEKTVHQTDLAKVALLAKAATGNSSQTPEVATAPPPVAAAAPVASIAIRQAPPASSTLFAGLPAGSASSMPDRASLPFKLIQTKAFWRGGILRVNFAIQYIRDDGGNQQGHIVILARGSETLLAYPDGVLNLMASDTLIKPDSGEYFSVSRFREVTAEFGPVPTRDQIQEVQILLLDANKNLLVQERLIPEKPAPRKRSDKPLPDSEKDDEPAAPAAGAGEERPAEPAGAPATSGSGSDGAGE
ncbi:MAG: hypothetical protein H7222_04825 [Methylotenera sp.]|nr:hypothetical protein [Oligoflexia bacterium]